MTARIGTAGGGIAAVALSVARDRLDIVATVVGLGTILAITGLAPSGTLMSGVIVGVGFALQAIGLVLVYRANRIINFSQIFIGAVAAQTFLLIVQRRWLILGLANVCNPCVSHLSDKQTNQVIQRVADRTGFTISAAQVHTARAQHWMVVTEYVLALVLALALGLLLTAVVYAVINLGKLRNASRLVVTVFSIAAGLFAADIGDYLRHKFRPSGAVQVFFSNGGDVPWHARWHVGSVLFNQNDIATLLIGAVAIAALMLYLRRGTVGLLLRGSAENPDRARTLGVNTSAVSFRAWVIAGALTTLASVAAEIARFEPNSWHYFLRGMAGAVAAGFVSLPLAIAAGVGLGVTNATALHRYGSDAVLSGLLVLFVVVVMLAQQRGRGRLDAEVQLSWPGARQARPTPPELARVPVVRRTRIAVFVLLGIVVLGYPWVVSPTSLGYGQQAVVAAMIGLSLLVLTGWAGQISLAAFAFAGIGAWAVGTLHVPLVPGLLVGGAAGVVASVLVGLPALRLRGLFLAVSTLAFAIAVADFVLNPSYLGKWLPSTMHRPVLLGLNFDDDRSYYYLSLVVAALVAAAVLGLRRSRTARALVACRDNERAAQAFGVNLLRARMTAFALSGFAAGVGGVLTAFAQHSVSQGAYPPSQSIYIYMLVILGGLGSAIGPALGAVLLLVLSFVPASFSTSIFWLFIQPEFLVVLMLLWVPGGLSQLVFAGRDAWLRRVADRLHIRVPSLEEARADEHGRLPISPKLSDAGAAAFVPVRYRLDDQWSVSVAAEAVSVDG